MNLVQGHRRTGRAHQFSLLTAGRNTMNPFSRPTTGVSDTAGVVLFVVARGVFGREEILTRWR